MDRTVATLSLFLTPTINISHRASPVISPNDIPISTFFDLLLQHYDVNDISYGSTGLSQIPLYGFSVKY